MSIYSKTRVEIRQYITSVLMGSECLLGTIGGTPASGTFSLLTTNFVALGDDYFNDWREMFDYSGTDVGTSGRPTDWTNAGVLTFLPASTLTATDSVELHRIWTVAEINEAINFAIESGAKDTLLNMVDESIVLDSLLSDGFFDQSTITTYWADDANSTLSRDTTYFVTGTGSAKVVTDGTNVGYLTQSYARFNVVRGQTFKAYALVNASLADRVRLKVTDGVNTSYSDYADAGGFYKLEVSNFSIDDSATELTVQVYCSAGSAVTYYTDHVWLCGNHIYEYNLDTNFVTAHKIEVESDVLNRYRSTIPHYSWRILKEGTPRIWIDADEYTPTRGRRLRVHGMASPAGLSADSSQCAINPDFIANFAAMRLHQGRMNQGGPEADWHKNGYVTCKQEVENLRRTIDISLPAGSRWVAE